MEPNLNNIWDLERSVMALCFCLMKCAVAKSIACEICLWIVYIRNLSLPNILRNRMAIFSFLPILTLILWLNSLLTTCRYLQHRRIKTASLLCRRTTVLLSEEKICNQKSGSLAEDSDCLHIHHLWKEINGLGNLQFLKKISLLLDLFHFWGFDPSNMPSSSWTYFWVKLLADCGS